jgi:hypothetical protein
MKKLFESRFALRQYQGFKKGVIFVRICHYLEEVVRVFLACQQVSLVQQVSLAQHCSPVTVLSSQSKHVNLCNERATNLSSLICEILMLFHQRSVHHLFRVILSSILNIVIAASVANRKLLIFEIAGSTTPAARLSRIVPSTKSSPIYFKLSSDVLSLC